MAQGLPFSIDNILRADFPHPSRISKLPRVLRTVPALRGGEKPPFVALWCQLNCCMNPAETRLLARENYTTQLPAVSAHPEDNGIQNSSGKKEQRQADEDSSEENNRCSKKGDNKEEGSAAKEEKGVVKKKRNRSHFSQMQLKYLEDVFSRQQYLTRDERSLLANALDMTELQIRNWFQNRRYQLRHRGVNQPRQVPVRVLVSNGGCKETQM